MITLIGISGSLRKQSYNTALLRACVELVKDAEIEIARIDAIPLYNGDVEQSGIPQPVSQLQDKISKADGLVIVSPEYNNGVPGVLKNVIDWLSRPPSAMDRVFTGKPLAMLGATMGGFGTINAQTCWLPTLRALHVNLWNGKTPFMVSRAQNVFDASGKLIDETTKVNLGSYLSDFVQFAKLNKQNHA